MKKIYYLCLALGFMFSSVTFVSCGSDDGKINPENADSGGSNSGSGQDSKPQKTADRDEAGNIKITATNFPDPVFRGYFYDKYGADGVLSDAEIDNVTQLSLRNKGIKTLEGIEFFPLLTELDCSLNQLTSLDVSKNTALTKLDCGGNQLTSLDVSKNIALTKLYCFSNQLTSLDVSKNTKLTELECGFSQLTSIDVSKNTALTRMYCQRNQLTSLDVSKNIALTKLYCYSNQLTSLDVSGCTALTELDCFSNQLTSLDVSGCTALRELSCYNNQIKGVAMDALVESLPTVSSGNMRVISAVNEGNVMTKTQIRAARAKGWIPMSDSYRTQGSWVPCGWEDGIDVVETNFPDKNFRGYLLSTDYGVDCVLTDAEIAKVTLIDVHSKSIKSLKGIEYFTALTMLYCDNNQLTSLDVSKNTALTMLDCNDNQLTSLDVSKNTALTRLDCGGNQLTSLDLSKNTALTMLYCYQNKINGESMDALVASLPTVISGNMFVICYENEQNVMTTTQVAAAKAKGWIPYYTYGSSDIYGNLNWEEYPGVDP